MICVHCGGSFERAGATGPAPAYCSANCRSKASYHRRAESVRLARREASAASRATAPKACKECGVEFVPAVTSKQVFCSRACNKRASNRAHVARRPICKVDGCATKSVSGGWCKPHHPTAREWSIGNPETRRENLRRKTAKRRAILAGDPDAENIDRTVVGHRDGWRCGLCRKPVDQGLPWPDPMSPSLDHIMPLSKGGKHVMANVQISHLTCNVRKSNRVDDVQLLLVG